MQLNKIIKGLVVALPVVTLMACSSSPSDEQAQAEANRAAAEAAAAERAAAERAAAATPEVGSVSRPDSPEEVFKKELETLQNEQLVYFDFDRSSIKAEHFALLDKHASFLVKNPGQTVTIEGHCDSRGTPEYNIALGERRAKAVATYLQNYGVSASQISTVSYGEEKPVNPSNTEAAFAENRRGVLVYR